VKSHELELVELQEGNIKVVWNGMERQEDTMLRDIDISLETSLLSLTKDLWNILNLSNDTSELGGRIMKYVDRWESTCGGGSKLRSGFQIAWKSQASKISIDLYGRKRGEIIQGEVKDRAMEKLVNEGLRDGILIPIDLRMVKLCSNSYVVPKAKGGFRQVLDLRILNEAIKDISFKMEDMKVVKNLARWGILLLR
jgi:hypothetical protein